MSDSSPSKSLGFFCSAPPQEQEKCHITQDLSLVMFAFSPPTIPVEGASHYQIKCTVPKSKQPTVLNFYAYQYQVITEIK
jgi:hypothetical protein